ncbi:hypothetical protein B0H13DRAFT_1451673, partial [Mycena leptocephala]
LFRTCQDLVLNSSDVCVPGNFVILKNPDRIGETFVGKVEEIIQQVGSSGAQASTPDGILIQKVILLRGRPRYGMPSVILKEERAIHQTAVSFDIVLHLPQLTQHNCMDNLCGPTGSRPVFQERVRTDQTKAQIAHSTNPTDLVLNTAQMRDAVHLQRFRIDTPHLDSDTVILQSAVNELAA